MVECEPLCDLLPLALEPTDTGLQAYALPATPQQTPLTRLDLYGRYQSLLFKIS